MVKRNVYKVEPGNFKKLKIRTELMGDPSINEVQVEVKAIGLNFADVFSVLGLYSAAPKESFIPGLEFSGVVSQIGAEVSQYQVGQKVMGVTRFGAFASHINIDQEYLLPIPNGWTFEEGSAYLVQVLTAYYGLINLGALGEAQTVLIHSAAGGVGIWANRICKKFRCYTIGTVGSPGKLSLLESEGYDDFIVRDRRQFKDQLIKALNGRPLNLIMESIGGSVLQHGYDLLAPMGRTVVFGSAHYGDRTDRPNYLKLGWKYIHRPKIDPQAMISANKSVMGFNLIYLFEHKDIMHTILSEIEQLHLGRPIIGITFEFDALPQALRAFQSGSTIGKVVIQL
jgi:NADPH:quinone reductase-like Zn-dependent oxidoreductase